MTQGSGTGEMSQDRGVRLGNVEDFEPANVPVINLYE